MPIVTIFFKKCVERNRMWWYVSSFQVAKAKATSTWYTTQMGQKIKSHCLSREWTIKEQKIVIFKQIFTKSIAAFAEPEAGAPMAEQA